MKWFQWNILSSKLFFIFGAFIGSFWRSTVMLFSLILKVGQPPIHLWFLKISFWIKKNEFIFFRTIHKLFPLILISLFLGAKLFPLILLFVSSGLILFQAVDFFYVILRSSLVHKNWIVLSMQYRQKLGLSYWMVYRTVFLFLISSLFFFKNKPFK